MRKPHRRITMANRRARRAIDWESYLDLSPTLSVGVAGNYMGALLAPQDVKEHGGTMTVLRTLLDVDVYNVVGNAGAPTGALVAVGVRKCDDDGAGNIFVYDLFDPDVIEDSWMYYRMQLVGNNLLPSDGEVFYESGLRQSRHIDIPVKRKMNDTSWLVLYVQMEAANGIALPTSAMMNVCARTLVQGST